MPNSNQPRDAIESFTENNLTGHRQYQADRLGLARRLHETLAQDLAAIGYQLDGVIADSDLSDQTRAELRSIRLAVMESARSFRQEIYKLRRTDRKSLHAKLEELLSGYELQLDLTYPLLHDREEDLLCEAILEIARNTLKHSGANVFTLKHSVAENGLRITVSDNGVGKLSLKRDSFGLIGIDEVLRDISASYTCESGESGTTYEIHIPLKNVAS